MRLINTSLIKIVIGAVTVITLSAVFAKPVSASRYAVAFLNGVEQCGNTPGSPCSHT